MDQFWSEFVSKVDVWALVTILVMVLANLALGLILAVKGGKMELIKLADWLKERVIPYVGGYLVLVVAAAVPMSKDFGSPGANSWVDFLGALPLTAFAFIIVTLAGKLKEQLQAIGLPIPDIPILEAGKNKT